MSLILMLMLSPVVCTSAFAQGEEQQEETHAHASSRKWKGIDVYTVIGHSEYGTVEDNDFATKGKTIFLYNVGTGRFIIEGGNWGMEGRLFHEDFGRPLYLMSDGFIRSGITEKKTKKYLFGCNVPGELHAQNNWNAWNQYSFTVMMDADKSQRKHGGWNFERVPGETGDTYTYYMYEIGKSDQQPRIYLGAAWGECHAKKWLDDDGNPRESGKTKEYVLMDYDRACWTSRSDPSPCGDMTKKEVDGDMITIDELYQWRVVSKEEFLGVLEKEEIGLNPSVSVLVPDRDFTRNADNFDTNWIMAEDPDGDYSAKGHHGFTYGVYLNKAKQIEYNDNEAWNKPIRLKNVFDNSDVSGGDLAYGWKNSKNGFLTFEGVGRTYTTFTVPKPGWYQIQCYGFVQSEKGHNAYLFAKVANSSTESSYGGEITNNLVTVSADTHININSETGKYGNYTIKNERDNCLQVGEELRKHGESYKNTVWICISDGEFNGGKKTLMVGVGKDEATQSEGVTNNNNYYYYDTDWVCIDDIRVSYLGTSPAFFYEEEEDLNYLIPGSDNTMQFETSTPASYGGPVGQYGGAVCIERSLKTDQWNSFSFPMPVTGEQMRHAFGEDAQLARIDGIGTMSKNPNVIDFKTVSLRTTEPVVEPGNFYLLKPTMEPIEGYDPKKRIVKYYELGRFFFSVNENEPDTYTHERLSLSKKMDSDIQEIKSLEGETVGTVGVNYVQTPGFSNFNTLINNDGLYTGTEAKGIYAPNGSYVVGDNTIIHLHKDNRLKGFRGWIKLDQELDLSSKEISMFGMFDEEPSLDNPSGLPRILLLSADESVYDLFGRKVGKLGDTLPKGIYIVKGKKYMVK